MSTLSVMGRAAVIYTERSAGTAVGGLVAWALLAACSRPAYLSVLSVALVWLGQVGGEACGRAYAGRLFGVTSILVRPAVWWWRLLCVLVVAALLFGCLELMFF